MFELINRRCTYESRKRKWDIRILKKTGELRDAMDDICAILNKHGKGVLYFGVKPNRDVCGQIVRASSLDDVATHIKTAIKPMIYPSIKE